MADETNNSGEPETDNVEPLDNDNPEEWDYFDPDEDNEETPEPEGTDDEGAEVEEEEAETEAEEPEGEETDEQAPATATQDAVVELADGTKATVRDLISGNMRQQDYTRKSQEVAESRKRIEADAQRIEGITQAFVDHLATLIPQEPDTALALRDAGKYTAQKAQYDAAVAQVQRLMDVGSQAKQVLSEISKEDRQKLLQEENSKLIQRFPDTARKDGREKFFSEAREAALDAGFSEDELSEVTDSRYFTLAHYARLGMKAEAARSKVKAKVAKAPPAAPVKPGGRSKSGNAQAMRKLSQTGSMRDALAVDWE